MIPPLFLDPRLQHRQQVLRRDPRGPAVNGGLASASPGSRRARAPRSLRPERTPRVHPYPPGWSGEDGDVLAYRFLVAPPSLRVWAESDDVKDKQKRDQAWPKVLTILLPDEVPIFEYAGELDALDGMDISVGNCTEVVLYQWQLEAASRL